MKPGATYEELQARLLELEETIQARRDAEAVNTVLFEISTAVNTPSSLYELYASIHSSLGRLMDLPNFFIAIYDREKSTISFPYLIDEVDTESFDVTAFTEDSSLTGRVILQQRPLFLTEDILQSMAENNQVIGTVPRLWIGVPLKIRQEVIGVMAVQHYTNPDAFDRKDMEILVSVSEQVALAIEKKQTEEELRASQERLTRLAGNIRDVIWSTDLDLNYTYISPVTLRHHGWTAEEVMSSLTVKDLLTPESLALSLELLKSILEQGRKTGVYPESRSLTLEQYRSDGSTMWAELTISFEYDSSGKPCGLVGVTRDITEKMKAQEALMESERKYRTLIETTDTGFVTLDEMWRVMDANENYLKLTNRKDIKSLLGHSVTESVADHCQGRFKKFLELCLASGRGQYIEIDYKSPDSAGAPVAINASAVATQEGVRIIALCRNISDIMRAREIMIQTEKINALGGLAAGMAHEINNPLAGILQNTQVVINRLTRDLPSNTRVAEELGISVEAIRAYMKKRGIIKLLNAIQESGKRAARIVDNLLSFSRKRDGHFTVNSMESLLENALLRVRSESRIHQIPWFDQVLFTRDYDHSRPLVRCDRDMLEQVFINIIKNGIQAMEEKYNAAREAEWRPAFFIRTSVDGPDVVAEIEDNGPGMEEKQLQQVFEPFYTTKTKSSGTGIGLWLSNHIITRNHNGHLEATSVPGKGSRFVIRLARVSNTESTIGV